MLSEFDLIARYFTRPLRRDSRVALGVGDDCALLSPSPSPGMELAISSDMLVEGRHFFPNANPEKLAHKCLAVNLSDLAAMGAKPLAFTLALSLPEVNEAWLSSFSAGLFSLAGQYDCELIGGDTTKGPLNICITIFGELPRNTALRRNRAQPGDDVWVSGALGDARLALAGYRNEIVLDDATLAPAAERLHTPTPRLALGLALRGIAHAAIDISDGLTGDLNHILKGSNTGATLYADALPYGPMLARLSQRSQDLQDRWRQFALAGGDDYELCFTAPASARDAVLAAAQSVLTPVTPIGVIEAVPGLRLIDANNELLNLTLTPFDHFAI